MPSNRRGGLSREGRQYRNAVCALLAGRVQQPLSVPLQAELHLYPPDRRRRDWDNFQKGVWDALQHAGVYLDDCQIRRAVIEMHAAGVQHGRHVCQVLAEKHGVECGFVCGDTPDAERDELLARFRRDQRGGLFEQAPLKYLCNVNVLTTGFDAPNVDCVVLLRPTMSPGLYNQMVGRGFRLHPGKRDCLVLDYGGNVLRHGPVDQVRAQLGATRGTGEAPAKECPDCRALIAAAYCVCPECGHEFPKPEVNKHDDRAASHGVLSGEVIDQEWEVRDVVYSVHTKKDAPEHAPKTMRVDYRLGRVHPLDGGGTDEQRGVPPWGGVFVTEAWSLATPGRVTP